MNDSPPAADGSQTYDVTLTIDQTNTADAKYDALSAVTVNAVNRDDEFGLNVSAVTGQATEAGGTATFTVALLTQPSAAVTVAVSSRDPGEGTASPSSLVFTTGNWNTARTVTVTGVDDSIDDGTVTWQVRLDPASGDASYDGLDDVDVDVTTTDNDRPPTVTLSLDPASIPENGGVSTVTARLSHPSSADTTVTVTASPVESSGAVAGDYTLSSANTLTIAAGSISSGGVVTITARNNDVDAASDKTVTVSGDAENGMGVGAVTGAVLEIADDDEKGFEFNPETVLVAAGATATYTVALTSMPAGTVTVTISSDNGDLTVSPGRLTFAPSDWNAPQTVTVTATDDGDDYADAASLTHTASGGGYDGVTKTLAVAVAGGAKVMVGGAGETAYRIGGRTVTVKVEAGVPAGIELDLAALPESNERLTLTFAPEDAPAESDRFTYESAGARTVVDVTVTEGTVRSPGLRLCLPVEEDVRDAARGRPLLLLHYDGSAWADVPGSAASTDGTMVCADRVMSFSPFAVGYEDGKPMLERVTETSQCQYEEKGEPKLRCEFTVDEAIEPVTLPKATGDEPIDYALSPEKLPPGLKRDGPELRRLSGTPTEETVEEAPPTYTWTAIDVDGDDAKLTVTIKVVSNLKEARARLKAINESILPELSRATWGSAVDAVTRRLESPDPGGGVLASGLGERGVDAAVERTRA